MSRLLRRRRVTLLALLILLISGAALYRLFGAADREPPVMAAACRRCIAEGWQLRDLQPLTCHTGRGLFNAEGLVEFRVKGTDPPRYLSIALSRATPVSGWKITAYREAVATNRPQTAP